MYVIRIRTGWSTLAARKPNRNTTSGSGNLTEEEVKIIRTVINKADALERKEQIRIGYVHFPFFIYDKLEGDIRALRDRFLKLPQLHVRLLNLQYEQLCSNARGDGDTSCIICGYDFKVPKSLVTIQLHICQECTNVSWFGQGLLTLQSLVWFATVGSLFKSVHTFVCT